MKRSTRKRKNREDRIEEIKDKLVVISLPMMIQVKVIVALAGRK